MQTYILNDRVLCLRCAARKPPNLADDRYGAMRPSNIARQHTSYYRCQASQRGYKSCGQGYVRVDELDEQLVEALTTVQIPQDVSDRIEHAVAVRVGNAEHLKRIAELEETVKRVEYSWEQGFLDQEAYLAKRRELQREIESLKPVDHDDLTEAADLLKNFRSYWDACAAVENPAQARRELVGHIVQSVYVYDQTLVAIVFYSDYAVVLGENETAHAQIARAAYAHVAAHGLIGDSAYSQCGDDGGQPLPGYWILFRRGKAPMFFVLRLTERTRGATRHLLSDRLVTAYIPSGIRYRMPEPIGISHSHS